MDMKSGHKGNRMVIVAALPSQRFPINRHPFAILYTTVVLGFCT